MPEPSSLAASPDPASPPTPIGETPVADLHDSRLYINRELSWLAFNERVLDNARRDVHPLLERIKFLAIAANNLDEFYMIRVATLTRQHRAGLSTISPDGLSIGEQLAAVRARAQRMLLDIADCWTTTLRPLLEAAGIRVLDPDRWTDAIKKHVADHFNANVCPVLTPLAFDPGHPFPYMSNRSMSFAVVVEDRGRTKFARVKVPDVLPRFIAVPREVSAQSG